MDDSSHALWSAYDGLRGVLDPESRQFVILGLCAVRLRRPELWERLIESHHDPESLVDTLRAFGHALPHPVPSFADGLPRRGLSIESASRLLHAVASMKLTSAAFDVAMEQFQGDLKDRMHFTPNSVVRCMIDLLEPSSAHRVYDPCCGAGELVVAAAEHAIRASPKGTPPVLAGQVLDSRSERWTALTAAVHGLDVNLGGEPAISLRKDHFEGQEFDRIVANPPFNMPGSEVYRYGHPMYWRYGEPPRHNANFGWLQHVAMKLAHGGRAAVLMSNVTTASENPMEVEIRSRMIEAGVVECVVALPDRLFRSTAVAGSIWLMRSHQEENAPETLFIDATGLGPMVDRVQRTLTEKDLGQIVNEYRSWRESSSSEKYAATAGLARAVPSAEIQRNTGLLNPRIYVEPPVSRPNPDHSRELVASLRARAEELVAQTTLLRIELDPQLGREAEPDTFADAAAQTSTVPLGQCCEVLAGPGTMERSEPTPSGVSLVLPRSIKHNRILDGEPAMVEARVAEKLGRYRLVDGDIVCTRTGELGRYGLVGPEQVGWLLGPGCMRIRPGPEVDSSYLLYFLTGDSALGWVARNATGSAIKNISTKTLGRLPIVLPTLDIQRQLGALLGPMDAELVLLEEISVTMRRMREAMSSTLIPGYEQQSEEP